MAVHFAYSRDSPSLAIGVQHAATGTSRILDPPGITAAHIFTRVERRRFWIVVDPDCGKNFDHRKVWIDHYLQHFAACFAIDLRGFTILSNHFRFILAHPTKVCEGFDVAELAMGG